MQQRQLNRSMIFLSYRNDSLCFSLSIFYNSVYDLQIPEHDENNVCVIENDVSRANK